MHPGTHPGLLRLNAQLLHFLPQHFVVSRKRLPRFLLGMSLRQGFRDDTAEKTRLLSDTGCLRNGGCRAAQHCTTQHSTSQHGAAQHSIA
jgi:hypothetical protein